MKIRLVLLHLAEEARMGSGSGISVPRLFITPFAFLLPYSLFIYDFDGYSFSSLLCPAAIQILLGSFRCNACA